MTNAIGYYGQSGQSGRRGGLHFQNIYNVAAEWGPCEYDAAHIFVGNAVYALPVGRGRAFGKDMNKFADAVIGGWQTSGIVSLHTGFPVTINGTDASGTLARAARANCVSPAQVYGRQNAVQGGYLWFNPAEYAQPAPGTFGNCGMGTLRGPGLKSLDFNLQKTFRITGSVQQRRSAQVEFINLTNTPILNGPNRAVGPRP